MPSQHVEADEHGKQARDRAACACSFAPDEARTLIQELRDEVDNQWFGNHAEHCDNRWPHRKGEECFCPPPEILAKASDWLERLPLREGVDPLDLSDDPGD